MMYASFTSPNLRWALVIAIAVTLLSACGVPLDDTPRSVPRASLPEELFIDATPTPEIVPAQSDPARIFLVGDSGRLVSVGRDIVPGPNSILEALFDGPTDTEIAQDLSTALEDASVLRVLLDDSAKIAFVNLRSSSLDDADPEQQLIGFGQIVHSLTSLSTIERIVFTVEGEGVEIPTDDGPVSAGTAVGDKQFASLDPIPAVSFVVDDIPVQGATAPTPTSVSIPSEAAAPPLVDLSVWLVNTNAQLTPLDRTIRRDVDSVVTRLFAGPLPFERAAGVSSEISSDAAVKGLGVFEETGLAVLDLEADSLPLDEASRRLAVAQLVYTLTELPDVERVLITVDSEGITVESDVTTTAPDEASDPAEPPAQGLQREDFASLVAPSPDDSDDGA